jgi:hypothetical protein
MTAKSVPPITLAFIALFAIHVHSQEKPQPDKWRPSGPPPESTWKWGNSVYNIVAVARVAKSKGGESVLDLLVPKYQFEQKEGRKWLQQLPNGTYAQAQPNDEEKANRKMAGGQPLKEHVWNWVECNGIETTRLSVPLKDIVSKGAVTDIDNKQIGLAEIEKRLNSPRHVLVNFNGWRGSPEKFYASVYREDIMWINLGVGAREKYEVKEVRSQTNAPDSRIGRSLISMSLGRDRVIGGVRRDRML